MTTGAYGSQTTYSHSFTTPAFPGGSPVANPFGWRRSRNWSGGDSTRPYSVVAVLLPARTQIVEKRRRDGSVFHKEIIVRKARVKVRKVYTRGFWPPNDYVVDYRGSGISIGKIFYGHYPCQPSGQWRLFTSPYIPPVPSASSLFTSNDDLRIVNKLSAKINESDFNPAVFVATLDQSLSTIADRAKKIAKSIAYIRKGDLRRAHAAVYGYSPQRSRLINGDRYLTPRSQGPRINRKAAAAQTLLEIQYGWRPLIDDMYEGATWIASKLKAPMFHKVAQRLQRVTSVDLRPTTWVSFANQQIFVRKQIIAYLEEGRADTSINVWSPAEVLWERLPWSFVVDWAIPIGEYLSARGAASTLKGTFVTTTLYQKKFWGSRFYGDKNKCEEITSVQDWAGISPDWQEFQMTRVVTTSLDPGLPVFKGLAKTASWEHCMNAVALLTGVMNKPPDVTLRELGRLRS